nr:MAG TPA: hypothetical protein [Bacteriophage sp.]
MLCLYIGFLCLLGVQVYPVGAACILLVLHSWRQLPTTRQAYYTHFIQRCQRRFKAVLLCRLINLHRHNKTAAQGKTQNHNAEIVSHTYKRKESAVHFSLLKF